MIVLGKTGFIGSTVSELMPLDNEILVNCAGFSKKHVANANPKLMLESEHDIIKKINDLPFSKLIHISSIDAEGTSNYGRIKKHIEECLLSRYPKILILRLGGVVGPGLKKNVVFDLLNNLPLFVTEDSRYNFISTIEIAKIILSLLNKDVFGILNVGATDSISVKGIALLLKKTPVYGKIRENYLIDTSKLQSIYKTKRSSYYLCNEV